MKTKNLLLMVLPILAASSLIGCNGGEESYNSSSNNVETSSFNSSLKSISSEDSIVPGSRYEIIYKDGLSDYLYGENPTYAEPGSLVEIKTHIIYDADLVLYAYLENGLDFFNETLHYESKEDYWSFTFMMPGCPVTIDYEIVDDIEINYANWPTDSVQTLVEYLISDCDEVIPSYDYALEIEINTDFLEDELYFGIYCYVDNGYESEAQYINKLNENNWSTSEEKIEDFYEAYSPEHKIWLNFKYDSFYKDLEIYVTEAPITSWPKDLISEYVNSIVENTTTEIPSFDAELYVVNYYPLFGTLAINGYGVDENIVSTYKNTLEGLNWLISDGVNDGEYDAISPNKDIKVTFYYDDLKNEFNVDVQKKLEDSSSWPKESIADLVSRLGYTGEVMEFEGEYISVEIDANYYPPALIVFVEDGTQDACALAYNNMLLNNGYVKAGTMYGEDIYNYPGTTLAYHATCLGGACFTIELFDVSELN